MHHILRNDWSRVQEVFYNFQNLLLSIVSACNQKKTDQESTLHIKLAISFNN
jgi:hypothetical protein